MDVLDVMKHNDSVAVGDKVRARWTNCHYSYSGVATVSKVNACSVRVTLDEAVSSYPAGREVTLPRLNFRTLLRWSWGNSVTPVEAVG